MGITNGVATKGVGQSPESQLTSDLLFYAPLASNINAVVGTDGSIERNSTKTCLSLALQFVSATDDNALFGTNGGKFEGANSNGLLHNQAIIFSTYFENAVWTKTNVSIDTDATGLFTTLAQSIIEDTSTGVHEVVQNVNLGAHLQTAISVYAEPNGRSDIRLSLENTTDGEYAAAIYNLSTGTVTTSSGAGLDDTFIQQIKGGAFRVTIVGTAPAVAETEIEVHVATVESGTTFSYTGDGVSGLALATPQLEDNNFASSPILNAGSINTRLKDELTFSSTTFSSKVNDLSVYAEFTPDGITGSSQVIFDNTDDLTQDGLLIFATATDITVTKRVSAANTTVTDSLTITEFVKHRILFTQDSSSGMSLTVDNRTPVTDADTGDVNWQTSFALGATSSTFIDPVYGDVSNVRIVDGVLVWQDLIDRGWTPS